MRLHKIAPAILALPLLLWSSVPARADLIRITPLGVDPSAQTVLDPVPIGSTGFRLTYWGGGSDAILNPVELILAVPGSVSTAPALTAGTLSGVTSVSIDLGDSQARYGGSWNTTTGYAGLFDSTTNPKVYDYIGFATGGDGSENYPNWSGASGQTSWSLFVYALTFSPAINHGDWAEFTTSLPGGSFVVGYGCTIDKTLNPSNTVVCKNPGATETVPFTFAGMVTPPPPPRKVPEPSTAAFSGIGLALLWIGARRRQTC